ncbi:hypothetical protein WN55_06856 [Dufourea novaeangliae]|uniref:Uncharacterized protein n=1 Tax=Dufourea novaeangliae TaxID=178035 RepID=A0A154P1P0_DUFNO|nr:hypothetical protein WN55_06856 [Dufourea novaeangliae]
MTTICAKDNEEWGVGGDGTWKLAHANEAADFERSGENHQTEISEYRNLTSNGHNQTTERKTTTIMDINKQSYASATQNNTYPTKDQEVIVDAINGVSIKNYAVTIDSKNTVQKLTSNHKTISVNNTSVEGRALIVPSERIILSNVSPSIPQECIEKIFTDNNVRTTSKLSYLRAVSYAGIEYFALRTKYLASYVKKKATLRDSVIPTTK